MRSGREKETEGKEAELQQGQQEHERDATEAVASDRTTPAPVASSRQEKPKLTSEQDVERTQLLISKAVQGGDINAAEWVNAGRKIRILKEWSQNIITPPPQALIDWLMSKTPEVPTKEEVDRAGIIQAQALALEAALPAWKKSAIAQQAVKEFSSRSSSEAPGEEATDCWAFWRKAPAAPDSVDQVLQKARESQQAWEAAVASFNQHISSLRVGGEEDELALSVGPQTSAQVLAQARADELSNLKQFQKFSEKYLKALERQEKIEGAMAAYNAAPNESNFRNATDAIETLASFSAEINQEKRESPQQFKEQWEKYHKRSNYIKTVYSANLAASRFWALYDKASAKPTLSAGSLAKGNEAVALFNEAIAAKKGLLSEASQLKITGLELENQEPLTREEQAAKARIAEFQEEIDEIKRAMNGDLSARSNQGEYLGTEQDNSI